jgi:hypothetical protein
MHGNTGSRLAFLVLAAALAAPGRAHAQVTDAATCPTSLPSCTATKLNCCTSNPTSGTASTSGTTSTNATIIVPMDRCHQPPISNTLVKANDATSPNWCYNPVSSGQGMDYAYGLVYRVMQWSSFNPTTAVPVYWIVNPTKKATNVANYAGGDVEGTKDVDFWVLASGANPPASGGSLTALSGTTPLRKLTTNASDQLVVDTTWGSSGGYQENEFPMRGSAFLISGSDRANFNTFWAYRPAGRTGCGVSSGANCYDFTAVAMYEVDPSAHFSWQDYTLAPSGTTYQKYDNQVPIAMRIDYAPPKIAAIYSGSNMTSWLSQANLNDFATNTTTCKTGTAFAPTDSIACAMSEADIQANDLKTGGFSWAWINTHTNGLGLCNSQPYLTGFLTAINGTYSAGNVMYFDDGIDMAEQCSTNNTLGITTSTNGLPLAGTNINETTSNPLIVRWPANLMSQFGDEPLNFSAGTVTNWASHSSTNGSKLYNPLFTGSATTLRRLMTQEHSATASNPLCVKHDDLMTYGYSSPTNCDSDNLDTKSGGTPNDDYVDLFAYGRYQNNTNNGIVFYSPGNNISPNNQQAQLRMVLSALIATPPLRVEEAPSNIEITRSAPIAATLSSTSVVVQGSYEYQYVTYNNTQYPVPRAYPAIYTHDDVAYFTFPGQPGHLRARKVSALTTSASSFNAGAAADYLFDAGTLIPTATTSGCSTWFSGSCRTVFTTIVGGAAPANTYMSTANYFVLGLQMLPTSSTITYADQQTLIKRVLAGKDTSGTFSTFTSELGGIDRSTPAIIPPSNIASPGYSRPVMIYVGATDGMMHAFCGSVDSAHGCPAIGTELWAYVPRVNLPNLRYNSARIDGSPHVIDAYGAWGGSSTKSWKTILTFQTGTGDATTSGASYPTTPAVYAMDVTDPQNPTVLWEYTDPTSRGSTELGVGLTIAAGDAKCDDGSTRNLTIAETNNGGTGGSGVVTVAIDTETGVPMWKWGSIYSSAAGIATTAVPGGAVGFDSTAAGTNAFMNGVIWGDVLGELWEMKPVGSCPASGTTGTAISKTTDTNTPLFKFSSYYHPIGAAPAIYSQTTGGTEYAIVADGGNFDTIGGAAYGVGAATHYALAVNLSATSSATFTETSTNASLIPWKLTFGSGERAYDQPIVIGDQAFISTDSSLVNARTYGTSTTATGHVYAVNLGLAAGTQYTNTSTNFLNYTATTMFGGSSVTNSGTTVIVSSGSKVQLLGNSTTGTGGTQLTATSTTSGGDVTATVNTSLAISRKLWLRTE